MVLTAAPRPFDEYGDATPTLSSGSRTADCSCAAASDDRKVLIETGMNQPRSAAKMRVQVERGRHGRRLGVG
jgi:hypothetical protein